MVVFVAQYRCLMMLILCVTVCGASVADVVVLDSYFRPDLIFPQYAHFWNDNVGPGEKLIPSPLGGTLHVYVRNTGKSNVRIEDVLFDGVSLSKAIAFSDQRKFRKFAYAASIYFSSIASADKAKQVSAGEPVWWRFDPQLLKSGHCGELIIRLRRKPTRDVEVALVVDGKLLKQRVRVGEGRPRMETIAFSPDRKTAYLYVSRKTGDTAPNRVLLDGRDVTSSARILFDASCNIVPIICHLSAPLTRGSLHCFQVCYPKGGGITAAARVWDDEFSYGMWGAQPGKEGDSGVAKSYLQDIARHNVNTVMDQVGSDAVRAFLLTKEGVDMMQSLGLRRMVAEAGKDKSGNPWSYFLMDEPDAGDAKVQGLPSQSQVGALGQGLVDRSFEFRKSGPLTPQLLNIDMTFKPQNWYTYGQIPDILTADPYYQVRLAQAYRSKPERVPLFRKADFVYAVTSVIASSQAPRQANCVLFAGSPTEEAGPFRFATAEEKRIEAYYALAAGAKGISYWWFHSLHKGLQPGRKDHNALAQWMEIGLLGAELRTVGSLIMQSCPISLQIRAPDKLWNRALVCGGDTLILLCVNDDYHNDREGTHINPVENAEVSVALPSWLSAADAFEVSCSGTRNLIWSESDSKAELRLGKVYVTKMLVITSDKSLRGRLQQCYDGKFSANVDQLMRESVLVL